MKLLQWIAVPLISARLVCAEKQFPLQEVDATKSEVHTPKYTVEEIPPIIGVHFTTSYAVAAARYANGTTRDIVRVAGDADYTDLMLRWASWGERYSRGEGDTYCDDMLPKSRNAVIFTTFMTKIRKAIEKEMGATVTDIGFAYPKFDSWNWNDFKDGLERSGLKPSTSFSHGFPTFAYDEANTVYTGLGGATCKVRADCVVGRSVLINFDSARLSVALIWSESAFPYASLGYTGSHTKLGWWNLPIDDEPRAAFWAEVRERISPIVESWYGPLNRILLLGDHAADEEFLGVLKALVWEKQQLDISDMLNGTKKEDVEWLAARGAAELAWHDIHKLH